MFALHRTSTILLLRAGGTAVLVHGGSRGMLVAVFRMLYADMCTRFEHRLLQIARVWLAKKRQAVKNPCPVAQLANQAAIASLQAG